MNSRRPLLLFTLLSVTFFLLSLWVPPVKIEAVTTGVLRRIRAVRQGSNPAEPFKSNTTSVIIVAPTAEPTGVPVKGRLVIDAADKVMKPAWDGSPIVVEKFRLIFFTIPKNSCEEFKRLFRRMEGFKDWRMHYNSPPKPGRKASRLPHDPAVNGLRYLFHYTPAQATAMMNNRTWTKAVFLRNPLTRFLSAYLDKIVKHEYGGNRQNWTFEHFVSSVEQGFSDAHWNPQCSLIDCAKWLPRIDFIGRVESIAEDTMRMLKRIDAWEKFGATGWEGSGTIFRGDKLADHVTNATAKVMQYYTPDLERRVRALLKPDFDQISGYARR